ncbi:hypothetical protein [Ruegeria sp.]|uniref:hypothetical protein n=1 Tax=Ruegeria sp. TaxID=1879320 RepID=UPI003C7C8240
MGLEYDFDIVAIAPDEVDPEHGFAAMTGTRPVRALFRDFNTAQALRSASPKIRRIFLESGFSLETRASGEKHGFYPPEDTAARNRILKRLFTNIRNMGLQGEYCGEFDFWEFLNHVRTAKPSEPRVNAKPEQLPKLHDPVSTPPERTTVIGRVGIAIAVAVILFVVLKYLAERGATP